MNRKFKIAIPVIAGILTISTGAGVLAAQAANHPGTNVQGSNYETSDNGSTGNTAYGWYCGGPGAMMGLGTQYPLNPRVADLLGITVQELESQLSSGKTLAEIAAVADVSQDRLVQTLLSPCKDQLDLGVKYGYINEDEANSLLQQAQERIQVMITAVLDSGNNFGWKYMEEMMHNQGIYGNIDEDETTSFGPCDMMDDFFDSWEPKDNSYGTPGYGYGMMGGFGAGMMRGW